MPVVQLIATTSAEEHWRDVAGPWLRAQAASAWKEARPTVVLAPGRAEGFYLRSRIVSEGTPLLGIRFWTPTDARKFLLAHYLPKLGTVTQAELRLLARTCAERLAQRDDADNASLRSVIREPAAFLRAYDLLLGAGWNPAIDGVDYGQALARELQLELKKANGTTQAGLHRELLRAADASPKPLVANLLITGFNAAHWPLWDLLKAATLSAENIVMGLFQPRVFAQSVDQLWISSWENFAKTETQIPGSIMEADPAPFSVLASLYETGSAGQSPEIDLSFCVTPELASQTRGIVLHALDFLQRDNCTRLGIVFPQANALALNVAEALRRLGLLMNDGPGVLTPGIFEKRSWETWLALQDEPGVPRLIDWLRACDAEGRSFTSEHGLTAKTIVGLIDDALSKTLVDNFECLAGYLEDQSQKNDARSVAEFLRHRIALPDEASFTRFLELTRQSLDLRGWEALRAELEAEPSGWLLKSDIVLSRHSFIEWLRESTDSQSRTRGKESNHFYGKVHLLVYGQLGGQSWSHLILTGLNEGVWPRLFETGAFGSRHELDALNKKARTLNRRVRGQGSQGEGQDVVQEGFGHCLLPLERQELALRDLCGALDATRHAVCLAAMTTESARGLLPSDFFNHAYQIKTGRVLDEETFRRMANLTDAWCRQHDALFAAEREAAPLIEPTRTADAARRDPTRPFGAYEFAYDTLPERPIQLWATQWETAWNHPAQVWLESIIGASTWPDGRLSWPRAVGIWAHDWLAQALRNFREQGAAALVPLIQAAAERTARHVRERASLAQMELYPWWEQVWAQARSIAIGLGENLEPVLRGRKFENEYRIPGNTLMALPGSSHADFELKGRIDLLLSEAGATSFDPTDTTFSGTPCWVIDFKTGSAKALTAKDVTVGRGLQSLLYALAIRRLGAGATTISLLTRNAGLKAQIDLDAVLPELALFRSLEIMHRSGIFGMKPDAENEYGFAPKYPLATRFPARHILEAKWALVHGGAPGEGEDDA